MTASRASQRSQSQQTALEDRPDAAIVLRRFRLVFNAVKTHFRQVEKSVGIGGAQLWALSIVEMQPGIGVNDLAQTMDIHQSTASNLVKSLVKTGMIEAQRTASDKRMVQLYGLPVGKRLLRKAPGPYTGVLPQALAKLDRKTLARLDKDLAELILLLGVDDTGAGIPLGQ